MRTISAAIAIALLAATLGYPSNTFAQSPAAEQPWSLPRAIGALKSGEERERAAAKEYLLGLGSAAVDPLISLLRAALDTVDEPLAIIEEFKNAPQRAQSSIERAESWVRKWRSHMQPPGPLPATQAAGSVEDSARVRSRQCEEARRIPVQLGCVLERMGDQGTIAALEEALTSNTDPCDTGKSIIENTISRIRMRPSFYLNRRD